MKEPWWVCACGTPIAKVGQDMQKAFRAHRPTCKAERPGCGIENLVQKRRRA